MSYCSFIMPLGIWKCKSSSFVDLCLFCFVYNHQHRLNKWMSFTWHIKTCLFQTPATVCSNTMAIFAKCAKFGGQLWTFNFNFLMFLKVFFEKFQNFQFIEFYLFLKYIRLYRMLLEEIENIWQHQANISIGLTHYKCSE